MSSKNISAYIIPNSDDHQSEFVAIPDRRREFITGFTGSNGDAVVTLSWAALWTDSRYYLQADEEMDCNWLLMRSEDRNVPSIAEWLSTELRPGSVVSVDSRKATYTEWKIWRDYLQKFQISLNPVVENLIDAIWTNRPNYPPEPIHVYEDKFAGETWQSKLSRLRWTLTHSGADMMVVTALDEVAWLLNLRGGDIPFTPVFRGYVLLGLNWATLYIPPDKITAALRSHLYSPTDSVQVMPYDWVWYELSEKAKRANRILIPGPLSTQTKGTSLVVHQLLPPEKIIILPSPIVNMKAYKNNVEIEGSRNAHIRDAVALSQLWSDLEEGLAEGQLWDEMKVVAALDVLRAQQVYNRGPSFESIVAFGTNGALPHYIPKPTTNKMIDNSSLLTIDSGGQYLDGTIDTTRVFHFGKPTARQVEIYTALLQGCINLASTVFPAGQTLQELDVIIRGPLYKLGHSYGHGSTHGTGVYLGVHEAFNYTYEVNFIGSQEPGFYKENDFGMRLENLVRVVEKPAREGSRRLLGFEPLTLVPYERKLINFKKLDKHQVKTHPIGYYI
ncbi:uncharacterized protein LOC128990367 [Macrosteles quadrilineatus]|uniref:uncharacterized protein LOC128990367 n=1 Tax=Macrosteles quadrilineatus TaxID=74068 RepID=UPI0023E2F9DB|nr:uncharacterized protein LOC128990367 [Macrosteles quadrilineatus]